ncbi:hypothetical protein E2C01_025257 [Portunus trituberculatus]|uniref:Uncharacterized protein n=1 Tax=Portunus trituberculatus TaxID=210409 RepID=A0A5B7EFI1_PORTR|nr:hypothetical protein [Portunus trituberculatus]
MVYIDMEARGSARQHTPGIRGDELSIIRQGAVLDIGSFALVCIVSGGKKQLGRNATKGETCFVKE